MGAIHPAPAEFSEEQISADPVLRYFHYAHLPAGLREISEAFCTLAHFIVMSLPRNPERTVALRKLLEAKDAGVRANVGAKPETFVDRLRAEHRQLGERVSKLAEFFDSPGYEALDQRQKNLLQIQHVHMTQYLGALDERMDLLGLGEPAEFIGAHDAGDRDEIIEARVTGGGSVEDPIPFKGD